MQTSRMQRRISRRCVPCSYVLRIACSAQCPTPRTWCRRRFSAGSRSTEGTSGGPRHPRAARAQRETYIGPWLPDPVVEEEDEEDVTLPLMLALERLSPLERAAFLLHDVFGLGFEEVAATIQRDPAACRQLATRARTHVREARPRFQVDKRRGLELAEAFFAASRS